MSLLPAALGILAVCATFMASDGSAQETRNPASPAVDRRRLESHVKALSGINPPRNYRNLSSLHKAIDYIEAELHSLGCQKSLQRFTVEGREYANVVCSFGPGEGERIVVGAHYDVAGETPGADDNASGVAGALEVARALSAMEGGIDRRVDIVFYSLEEPPFFGSRSMGSYVHAASLAREGATVRLMLSLECIGYFVSLPGSQGFPLFVFGWMYPDRGNFAVVVGKWGQGRVVQKVRALMAQASRVPVESIAAPSLLPGIDLSDHLNYWKFGHDAVMITDTAFYRNPHYHRLTDTPDTLDYDAMAEVVKGVIRVVLDYDR